MTVVILSEAKDLIRVPCGVAGHEERGVGPSLAPLAQDER
jgi:hypothetical protein